MSLNPETYSNEIRRIYAEAEEIILNKIARQIERGIDIDDSTWTVRKLAEIKAVNRTVEAEIITLKVADKGIADVIAVAYFDGAARAASELIESGLSDIIDLNADIRFAGQSGIRALVKETIAAVESTHFRILRVAQDMYRQTVSEASAQAVTGTLTRRQAAQQAMNRFADRGITGFVDKAGRNWDLASYTEMATRTSTLNAQRQGHADKLVANGKDLVIITDHAEECPLCRPYEGKIYSLSGTSTEYPALSTAKDGGLFHPSCSHSYHLWTPGLSRIPEKQGEPADYEERQKHRALDRNIRHWKRREAVAITNADKAKATAKVKEWQGNMRAFISETDRRRDYGRESTKRAR